MDTVLLSIYRLVDSEMKILYDAVQVYYYYTPQGNQRKSLKHFASGLTTLIKLEGKKGGYDESNLITGEAEVIGDGEFNDDDAISIQSMEGEDALSSQLPEENTSIHHYLHQSTNQYSISYLLWEFFHGVVLKFTVEELSQYPIWRSKIRTILGEVEGLPGLDATVAGGTQVVSSVLDHSLFASLSRLVFNFHREIMHIYGTGSLMNYLYGFQGCVPYLTAACVANSSVLYKSFSEFMSSILTTMRRTPSLKSISTSDFMKAYAQSQSFSGPAASQKLDKMVSPLHTPTTNGHQVKHGDEAIRHHHGRRGNKSLLQKIVAKIAIHPFITMALHMVSKSYLFTNKMWMSSYVTLLLGHESFNTGDAASNVMTNATNSALNLFRRHQLFFTGARASVLLGLAANSMYLSSKFVRLINQSMLDGILYRCMLAKPGTNDMATGGIMRVFGDMLIKGDLVSATGNRGWVGLLEYTLLTVYQIIPGFLTFSCSKVILWLLFGYTVQRKRQKDIRRRVLEHHWDHTVTVVKNKQNYH